MASRSIAAFTPCCIIWEDAASEGSDQHDDPASALRAYKPTIRKSIGYFVGYAIKDGRECAILATDDDRTEDSPLALGGTFRIPKGMILSIEALRIAPPAKKKRV